jgi:predicted TIM-barrel fold metal-dependent hydrolase
VSQRIGDANTLFGFWTSRQADLSPSVLKGVLDRHEVAFACTLSTVGIFYDFAAGNRQTLEVCADDERLLPAGTVDPRQYFGCAQEIAGARERGLRMLSLFPETQGWSPGMACFGEVAQQTAQEGLPLMVECGAAGTASEVVRATQDLELPVVLSGVGQGNLAEAVAAVKQRKRTYLETHALSGTGAVEAVVEQVGAERLVFGSRSPLHYFSSAYLRLKYAVLKEADLAAASGENLAALLEVG